MKRSTSELRQLVDAIETGGTFNLRHRQVLYSETLLLIDDGAGNAVVDGAETEEKARLPGEQSARSAPAPAFVGVSIMGTSRMSGPAFGAFEHVFTAHIGNADHGQHAGAAAMRQRSAASAKVMWPCSISIQITW